MENSFEIQNGAIINFGDTDEIKQIYRDKSKTMLVDPIRETTSAVYT